VNLAAAYPLFRGASLILNDPTTAVRLALVDLHKNIPDRTNSRRKKTTTQY